MCCYTHHEPVLAVYGGQLATDESLRCRCETAGVRCVRQATEEDRLCDRCRAPEPGPPVGLADGFFFGGKPDWYAAGRVPGFEFRTLRGEGLLDYDRIGLSVARPQPAFIISGLG